MAHRRGVEEEDATYLRLGPGVRRRKHCPHRTRHTSHLTDPMRMADFLSEKVHCLMNADVALILERKRAYLEGKGIQPKPDFVKTYEYVNQVKQFRDQPVVKQVRKCAAAIARAAFSARCCPCARSPCPAPLTWQASHSYCDPPAAGIWRLMIWSPLRWRS